MHKIETMGAGICSKCRWMSGCLACDPHKCTSYWMRRESARSGRPIDDEYKKWLGHISCSWAKKPWDSGNETYETCRKNMAASAGSDGHEQHAWWCTIRSIEKGWKSNRKNIRFLLDFIISKGWKSYGELSDSYGKRLKIQGETIRFFYKKVGNPMVQPSDVNWKRLEIPW